MFLAIDVGNTNITLGVYKDANLIAAWTVRTQLGRTIDEYGMLMRELLNHNGMSFPDVTDIAVSNVVPPTESAVIGTCEKYFGIKPLVVDAKTEVGINIFYEPRADVGADRIVNAVAAFELYGGPAVIVDLGTATTFDAISAAGDYLGGAIAPGIGISMEALFRSAARLPRIDLVKPESPIGTTTVTSMQAGFVFGFAGQIDEIVARFGRELGGDMKVIATGGLAEFIAGETRTIQKVNRNLTLEGLRIIYSRNAGK